MRLPLIFLLLLGGCAAYDPAAIAEMNRQRQAYYVETMTLQCEALGFQRNGPDIRQCMLNLHQSNLQRQQAERTNELNYRLATQPRQETQTNCWNTLLGVRCNTR